MNYGIEICLRELLFEQECVIIPNFGGFLTQYKSAEINHLAKLIFPPTKSVTFNRQLKNDDGLLTNTYAALNNVSYSEAAVAVKKWIAEFEQELHEKGEATISKIGTFFRNKTNGTITFDFEIGQNYLPETYGLSYVKVSPILRNPTSSLLSESKEEKAVLIDVIAERAKREAAQEAVLGEPFLKETIESEEELMLVENTEKTAKNAEFSDKKKSYNLVVAFLAGVAFAVVLTLPIFNIHAPNLSLNEANVFSVFNKLFQLKDAFNFEPIAFNENAIPPVSSDIKIAAPVFVDSETYVSNETPAKISPAEHKYEIVFGTFAKEANAEKMMTKIKAENPSLNVLRYEKNGKNYVVMPAGNNEAEARKMLDEAREASFDCWMKTQ